MFVLARHLWLLGLSVGNVDHLGTRWWLDDRFFDRRLKLVIHWAVQNLDANLAETVQWRCRLHT